MEVILYVPCFRLASESGFYLRIGLLFSFRQYKGKHDVRSAFA